jgi:hypothetical protein
LTPAPIRVGRVPGNAWEYSGGGYCVLEQLLEDVTGRSFPDLARESVLTPLGMTNSTFTQPLPANLAGFAAVGHQSNGKPLPGKWNTYPATTAAGLWTTPSDLARFVIAIRSSYTGGANKILSRRLTRAMLSRQGAGWGLGVGLAGQPPIRFFHTGSNPGYQSELEGFIDEGDGAVVMANGDQGWRLGQEILWSIAREYQWPVYDYAPTVKQVIQIGPHLLDNYAGRYELDPPQVPGVILTLTNEGGHLFARNSDEPGKVELHPESETKFFTLEDAVDLTFVKDNTGAVSGITSDQGWRARRLSAK